MQLSERTRISTQMRMEYTHTYILVLIYAKCDGYIVEYARPSDTHKRDVFLWKSGRGKTAPDILPTPFSGAEVTRVRAHASSLVR